DIVADLSANPPRAVVTCARGSSDHAATYMKYLVEARLGVLTSSASPSVQSVYGSRQQLHRTLYVAISQSGQSPDLLENVANAKSAGATVLAIVNDDTSPLAATADHVIPVHAGTELSVAATKSYIATLTAVLHLISTWCGDGEGGRLADLPQLLNEAWSLDWHAAVRPLAGATSMYVISRGMGLAVAQEAALKLKETCGLHAEAFSSAEVRHGPMTIAQNGFPVLMFMHPDETLGDLDRLAEDFRSRGAMVVAAGTNTEVDVHLPVLQNVTKWAAPILTIQSFYKLANDLAFSLGRDPDNPPFLKKVTETI
ncbi:MAG: SIS domain-containing protein, partial [Woeseiaceae bacterium]